jgi:hypothetical protein
MTNATPPPDDALPPDAYTNTAGELRALARVLRAALGMITAYWALTKQIPRDHPYHKAVLMVDAYLKRRYDV